MTTHALREEYLGRILCVTSNFPRWAGDSTTPFVLHLAQDLQELGWRVDVLAPHAPGTASREVIGGVSVERFRYLWPERTETVCYQGGALINLRKKPSNAAKLPALVMAEWFALFRRLAGRSYDALHSHWILPQGFAGVLSAGLLRIPHMITVHGGDVFALRGKALGNFKRFSLRRADAVTVNSSATERAVLDIADSLPVLRRIPMGVSPVSISRDAKAPQKLRSRYRLGSGPLLLFVGRIVEEKGVEDLLLAVRELAGHLPDITVLIVGEGQDRGLLERRAREIGIAHRVTFTGWVQPPDIPNYLAASDVFVGPSRRSNSGWTEAQGLSFLEAMVGRIPVVAAKVGGISDIVRHEETGLLVDERAPTQIAAAIARISRDPEFAAGLTRRAYELATTNFARSASARAFAALFSEIVCGWREKAGQRSSGEQNL